MRSTLRLPARLLPAVALVALCGCTKGYHYDLRCVVRNAVDGKPLVGVKAMLDTRGHLDDPDYAHEVVTSSDADGRLGHKWYVYMRSPDFNEHWYLKLEKEGFVTEVIDIKPGPEPKEAGVTIPVFVVAYLRPKAPGQ